MAGCGKPVLTVAAEANKYDETFVTRDERPCTSPDALLVWPMRQSQNIHRTKSVPSG
jgi:hypothetical protein